MQIPLEITFVWVPAFALSFDHGSVKTKVVSIYGKGPLCSTSQMHTEHYLTAVDYIAHAIYSSLQGDND